MKKTFKTFVIGDIHGQYSKLVKLMRGAGLVDQRLNWSGEDATLCFIGDFTDRGPDGLQSIDWIIDLQHQATDAGGRIVALLGNHEVLLLAAHRFGEEPLTEFGRSFTHVWLRNGGHEEDLARLTPAQIDWITKLPAMVQFNDTLLTHPDSVVYVTYGKSVQEVNMKVAEMMQSEAPATWDKFLYDTTLRLAFSNRDQEGNDQSEKAKHAIRDYLKTYGSRRLIHGHTPIHYMTKRSARSVTEALSYADGLCVNVDGGMYLGGPGFVHEL